MDQLFRAVVETDNTRAPFLHLTFLAPDGPAARRKAWSYMKRRLGHFEVKAVSVQVESPDPDFGPVVARWSSRSI